jgi:hypothetical protein
VRAAVRAVACAAVCAAVCAALWAAARAAATFNFVSGPIPPTAATSACRRTLTSDDTRLPAIPPGVQVSWFGTLRTARGSPRGGRSAAGSEDECSDPETPGAAGDHHRGGAGDPLTGAAVRIAAAPPAPPAASARRRTAERRVPAAKRRLDDARAPTGRVRCRPVAGPGKRIRVPTATPRRVLDSSTEDVDSTEDVATDVDSSALTRCRPWSGT